GRSPDGDGLCHRRARRAGASAHCGRRGRRGVLPLVLRNTGSARRVKADKVYLVGFMAAGKTSVSRALSRRLGWEPLDIDELIETRERTTVADIFARRGEPYFRAVERDVLFAQLPRRHAVVATGGGTFIDATNRAAINADGASVWLDVPIERV